MRNIKKHVVNTRRNCEWFVIKQREETKQAEKNNENKN
jgi:hypothetical protein